MRSSKSRSRNKPNRNRSNSVGNVVNRVFDSSGPEGKVRGTPQQIIEKYNQLARDAQLSNDRVAAENFQQHAEHYLRLLGEAQKEIDAKREQQERENRDRQAERDRERPQRESDDERGTDPANAPQPGTSGDRDAGKHDTAPGDGDEGSTLVETPESKPKRAPRKPRRAASQDGDDSGSAGAASDQPAAPKARAPRKSKAKQDTQTAPDGAPSDTAAE
ncbi:DUF4167 domain-containing protein [Pelagivirga sediminicola]|uniref:DUF4167 domain-containing protein n=1 Tax=Pelagivirga sediminicola TaxID=2170575 RepID=A0A2T7GBJ7_9RHOB|nr:DUF4167 domain-containing protein [Pelagivirga sediminicola]PVA11795.1 DUF4167 domain-containing protein [Pelagivirga sediminicola]